MAVRSPSSMSRRTSRTVLDDATLISSSAPRAFAGVQIWNPWARRCEMSSVTSSRARERLGLSVRRRKEEEVVRRGRE